MQNEPDEAKGDAPRTHEPRDDAGRDTTRDADADASATTRTDNTTSPSVAAVGPPWPRVRRLLTLGYGLRWHFDTSPSIFEALTLVVSVVGVYFLVDQVRQTDESLRLTTAALNEARQATAEAKEANRISREAMAQALQDGQVQDARAREQLAISRSSAAATLDAVSAAKAANEVNAANARLELRPWLMITSVDTNDIVPTATQVAVRLSLMNVGRTPAIAVSYGSFRIGIGNMTTPGQYPFPPVAPVIRGIVTGGALVTAPQVYAGTDVIGPGTSASRSITLATPLRPGQYLAMVKRTDLIYVAGELTYSDSFGSRYLTQICYVSDPSLTATEAIRDVRFRPYGDCNKAQ